DDVGGGGVRHARLDDLIHLHASFLLSVVYRARDKIVREYDGINGPFGSLVPSYWCCKVSPKKRRSKGGEMTAIQMFEVGGCVRDDLLGIPTKDVDFTVVAPSFDAMRDHLIREGFRIHVESPEFVAIRAGVPEGHPLRERTKDADFVLARKDAPTGDGRRPDFVEPGTLMDDLARRDFTVNAMAR